MYADRAWVDIEDDCVVVSWPGGHRRLEAPVLVADTLALVNWAVTDMMEEIRSDSYRAGYRHGWNDANHEATTGKPRRRSA